MPDPENTNPWPKKLLQYSDSLRDMRVVGLAVFVIIVLLISWSGVKVIETNYGLQREISRLEQQNDIQRLKNSNQKLENAYYQSRQYLDIAARQNFGLAALGETVLIVPKQAALKHTVDLPDPVRQETAAAEAKQPAYQRNFQAWVDFLLHRTAPEGD